MTTEKPKSLVSESWQAKRELETMNRFCESLPDCHETMLELWQHRVDTRPSGEFPKHSYVSTCEALEYHTKDNISQPTGRVFTMMVIAGNGFERANKVLDYMESQGFGRNFMVRTTASVLVLG